MHGLFQQRDFVECEWLRAKHWPHFISFNCAVLKAFTASAERKMFTVTLEMRTMSLLV